MSNNTNDGTAPRPRGRSAPPAAGDGQAAGPRTPRFPLGRVVATPGALALARERGVDLLALLRRHAAGDWGQVCPEDAHANERALDHGARLLSAYELPSEGGRAAGGRLWVITEADRSATTVLLPSEY